MDHEVYLALESLQQQLDAVVHVLQREGLLKGEERAKEKSEPVKAK